MMSEFTDLQKLCKSGLKLLDEIERDLCDLQKKVEGETQNRQKLISDLEGIVEEIRNLDEVSE